MEATKLGSGGTASVYQVVHKQSKKVFALKVVKLSRVSNDSKKSMLLREIALIKMLDHPNVIRVVEVFQSHTKLYIVMELCTGGELFDKLSVRWSAMVCDVCVGVREK
jgi:calcium-dependent protein kinase